MVKIPMYILSIAKTYERVLNRGELSLAERKNAAVEIIKEGAEERFDPQIAELYAQMMDDEIR